MIRRMLGYLGEAVIRLISRPLEREEVRPEVPAPPRVTLDEDVKRKILDAREEYAREQREKMRISLQFRVNCRGGSA